MNRRMLRLGRLAALSAVVAAVLATLSVVGASAGAQPAGCPTDKPLVVDSYFTAENSADFGADGQEADGYPQPKLIAITWTIFQAKPRFLRLITV